ncbi:MAG: DUF2971 domain-containing protein [Lacisediminihabitans sp.]
MALSPLTSSPLPIVHQTDTLWHYTNQESLSAIVSSAELWATSPRHQNDQTEGIYAWQIVQEVWNELRGEGLDKRGSELLDLAFSEDMGETVRRSVFTLSASGSPNVAHLWKEYAAQGTGFALGLDTRYFWAPKYRLSQILKENHFNHALPVWEGFFKVAYDPGEQRALASHALRWLSEFWWRVGELHGMYDPWGLYLDNARFIVRSLLLLMKDPRFAAEEEIRFIAGRPVRAEDIVIEHDDLAHLPLAALPFLGNDSTLPGTPVPQVVYGVKADPCGVLQLAGVMGLKPENLIPASDATSIQQGAA